ncbi:MAG: glycosyltransferase family 2 protein [Verrucomicrobia bacterium]|nr:MAG: glycosyltransferase family 2 protein [Verrucomicrobiota bacterium]
MHRITFGIINYNGAATLTPVIEHVLAQTGIEVAEILLVDNASPDGSAQMVRGRFGNRVRIIPMGDNRGPNPARNRALHEATTDLVLILDNDILCAPDYAARLAAVCDAHPKAGAVTGQIRFHAEPEKIQYNGTDIHYAGEVVVNRTVHPAPFVVATVSAGATLLSRKVVFDLGAFDEDLLFGWEDGDLTFRLTVCGHPCYAVSQAVCWHMSAGRSTKWVRLQIRNRWRFLLTHYDTRTLLLAFPGILFYQTCAGIFFTLKGQGRAFLGGCADAFRSRSAIRAKRQFVLDHKRVPDRQTLTGGVLELPGAVQEKKTLRLFGAVLSGLLHGWWLLIRPLLKK